jgi:putative heme-binding domain-containing protein
MIRKLLYAGLIDANNLIRVCFIWLCVFALNQDVRAVEDELIVKGESLFRTHCSRCHGRDGEGGEGSNLKRRRLKHATTDEELDEIIGSGIPGTGMPGLIWNRGEVLQVAAYVRSLGQLPVEEPPGDHKRGKVIFSGSACLSCHIVAGKGRAIGPELSTIGDQRGLSYLRDSLLTPAKAIALGSAPLSGGYQGYLSLRLKTRAGQNIEGLRVNEDAFSIQIRDMSGQLLSFNKQDLESYEKRFGHSAMPEAAALSAEDLNDLVSYLMTLREAL